MAWVIVGTGAKMLGGAVIGNVVGKAMGGGGSSASAAADPFASQREQYQSSLKALMNSEPGSGTLTSGVNSMLQPGGGGFQTSDPSYQFRLQQGTESLNRVMAKSGLFGSGNQLAALTEYGQGMASQEYGAQFNRLQSAQSNQYAQLAQLSGATSGSQGAAGQLLANQQAGSAAQMQQWGGMAVNAGKAIWDKATAPNNEISTAYGNIDYSKMDFGGGASNVDYSKMDFNTPLETTW